MHSRKRGNSGSKRPAKKKKSSWVDYNDKEIEQLILKLAKQGNSGSKIGLILRDSYGIPDIKIVTGKKVGKILAEGGLKEKLPEDLSDLIKKVIKIMKHSEINKKDMPSKRGLILAESKIRRLAKYYIRKGILEKSWKYNREKVKLLVG